MNNKIKFSPGRCCCPGTSDDWDHTPCAELGEGLWTIPTTDIESLMNQLSQVKGVPTKQYGYAKVSTGHVIGGNLVNSFIINRDTITYSCDIAPWWQIGSSGPVMSIPFGEDEKLILPAWNSPTSGIWAQNEGADLDVIFCAFGNFQKCFSFDRDIELHSDQTIRLPVNWTLRRGARATPAEIDEPYRGLGNFDSWSITRGCQECHGSHTIYFQEIYVDESYPITSFTPIIQRSGWQDNGFDGFQVGDPAEITAAAAGWKLFTPSDLEFKISFINGLFPVYQFNSSGSFVQCPQNASSWPQTLGEEALNASFHNANFAPVLHYGTGIPLGAISLGNIPDYISSAENKNYKRFTLVFADNLNEDWSNDIDNICATPANYITDSNDFGVDVTVLLAVVYENVVVE